jgi:transposase
MDLLQLSEQDRATLVGWARSGTAPARLARRAAIVLAFADGLGVLAVARKLRVGREQAALWRDRFLAGGTDALTRDNPRPGRPKLIPVDLQQAVLTLTRSTVPEDGTHWSVRTMAQVSGVSPATVQRIWSAHGIKPHLVRTFKLSKDPKFEEKLVDVVGLYLDPPEKALVLCVDEKSQIQALDRTQPGLPMKKGRCGTMTHDYKRHGTTALFAALEVATGRVIGSCKSRHRHQEFLAFLKQIDRQTPKDIDLHLVLDNYATHKHPVVKAWLADHPRFHLHFVPTSCSWLNLVERFFAKITTKRIRRGSFDSVQELVEAINDYLRVNNKDPKPFKWTASTEAIIEKVNRCREIYETLH